MADPNITPIRKEEETTLSNGQSVRRTSADTPDQVVREESVTSNQAGQTVRRSSQVVAPSPAAASNYRQTKRLFYAYSLIWYLLGFIEILLAFRFILKLLGANPNSGFASFIYGLSYPFAAPFLNLFSPATGRGAETTAVAEWSTLIAAIVYAIIAWAIIKTLNLGKPVSSDEIERRVEEEG